MRANSIKLASVEGKDTAIKILIEAIVAILKEDMPRIVAGGEKNQGDFEQEAGLDVTVIVKEISQEKREKIYGILIDLELEYRTSISLAFYSELEYKKDKQTGSFYN